jgi:hypothetical protein
MTDWSALSVRIAVRTPALTKPSGVGDADKQNALLERLAQDAATKRRIAGTGTWRKAGFC